MQPRCSVGSCDVALQARQRRPHPASGATCRPAAHPRLLVHLRSAQAVFPAVRHPLWHPNLPSWSWSARWAQQLRLPARIRRSLCRARQPARRPACRPSHLCASLAPDVDSGLMLLPHAQKRIAENMRRMAEIGLSQAVEELQAREGLGCTGVLATACIRPVWHAGRADGRAVPLAQACGLSGHLPAPRPALHSGVTASCSPCMVHPICRPASRRTLPGWRPRSAP